MSVIDGSGGGVVSGPLLDQLKGYVAEGIAPGRFLTAVLSNDLDASISRIDVESLPLLRDIVHFLYWQVPEECWGSPEAVTAWIARGGLAGKQP